METGFSLALSFIIGGALLLSILGFNTTISQTTILNNMDLSAQIKMKGMVDIIKNDIKKMGYKIEKDNIDSEYILAFTNDSLVFRTIIDTISSLDTARVRLYHNKSDSTLVREIYYPASAITQPEGVNPDESTEIYGLDSLHISYFDNTGHITTSAENIRFLEITVVATLDYTYKPDNNSKPYRPRAFWKSMICPKNLGR